MVTVQADNCRSTGREAARYKVRHHHLSLETRSAMADGVEQFSNVVEAGAGIV